jgi:plasmid stability protein
MASILIRGISGELKEQLRLQAAAHGRSVEADARELLKSGPTCPNQPAKNSPHPFARSLNRSEE